MTDPCGGATGPDWMPVEVVSGLISVVVPAYNRRRMLIELLGALAAQTWPEIEILIVDDGSTDGTPDAVRRWAEAHSDIDLRLLQQPNAGPATARNHGARRSRGEFIYFIDSDDLIQADALAAMAGSLRDTGAPYCLATVRNTDLQGQPIPGDRQGVPRLARPGDAFSASWLMHAALYRRDTVRTAGPFDETLPIAEDNLFRWKVVVAHPPGVILPREIGIRRLHDRGHQSLSAMEPRRREIQLQAICAFLDWYRQRPTAAAMPEWPVLRTLVVCAIWLGSVGRHDGVGRARAEIRRLRIGHTANGRLWRSLLTPRSRAWFGLLRTLLRAAQAVHRRLRGHARAAG